MQVSISLLGQETSFAASTSGTPWWHGQHLDSSGCKCGKREMTALITFWTGSKPTVCNMDRGIVVLERTCWNEGIIGRCNIHHVLTSLYSLTFAIHVKTKLKQEQSQNWPLNPEIIFLFSNKDYFWGFYTFSQIRRVDLRLNLRGTLTHTLKHLFRPILSV